MKVLFLDVDGVLNGHEWDDAAKSCNVRRECVGHLNRVCRETGCVIVVSSAWRYILLGGDMTPKGFGYMLRTHGLLGGRQIVVGHTRADHQHPADDPRADQVREWLAAHPEVTAYAVVDDEDDGFWAAGMPFVKTDGGAGLTAANADALVKLLNAGGA